MQRLHFACSNGREAANREDDMETYQTREFRRRRKFVRGLAFVISFLVLLILVALGALVAYRTIHPADEGMIRQSLYLTMRDGVKIAIDVWLPKGLQEGGRLPALLHQTCYYRAIEYYWPFGLFLPNDALEVVWPGIRRRFVTHGYAWVDVDVRGTGASYGCQTGLYPQEQVKDATEIVDWIIRQPWSDGQVGAFGISFDGGAAEMVLADKHPAVKAIAPTFTGFDVYSDLAFPGGVYFEWGSRAWAEAQRKLDQNTFGELLPWPNRLLFRGVRPVDGNQGRSMLAEAIRDHANNIDVYKATLGVTYRDDTFTYDWSSSIPSNSPYTYAEDIEASGTAIYSYTGWFDGAYAHAGIKRFLTLHNPGSKLTIGPWDHEGQFNLSPTIRSKADFDHVAELLRFFDYHLKGLITGIADEPPIRYYTMVEDKWKFASTWPPPAERVRYYFSAANSLTRDAPTVVKGDDTYQVDYFAGTGNLTRWNGLVDSLPSADIYPDRNEQDRKLLTYTSVSLDRDLEITGHPVITLYISSTALDGNFFAYLEDVDEQGHVTYVTEGMLRAIHRKLSYAPSPYQDVVPYHTFHRQDGKLLVPDKVTELIFDLEPTSYLFRQGHSLRVAVAGADRDHFFVPPGKPPTLRVYRNREHGSCIELPVVPHR
mgnify:CR=1 FL=1